MIADGWVEFRKGQAYLHKVPINEYSQANRWGHDVERVRKLLLHKHEIDKLATKVQHQGLHADPAVAVLQGPRVKVELALVTHKKQHDKRATKKEADDKREMRSRDDGPLRRQRAAVSLARRNAPGQVVFQSWRKHAKRSPKTGALFFALRANDSSHHGAFGKTARKGAGAGARLRSTRAEACASSRRLLRVSTARLRDFASDSAASVAVIRLAAEDLEPAVELLEHEDADEAVRDRQPAERDQLARALAQRVAVAVGAADREHDGRAAAVLSCSAPRSRRRTACW